MPKTFLYLSTIVAVLVPLSTCQGSQDVTAKALKQAAVEYAADESIIAQKPELAPRTDGSNSLKPALIESPKPRSPIEDALVAQIKLEVFRKYLPRNQEQADAMEPTFQRIEGNIALQLSEASGSSEMDIKRRKEMELERTRILWEGLNIKSTAKPAISFQNVRLIGPAGAKVDVIPEFSHLMFKQMQKSESDYDWESYNVNDIASLRGKYFVRVRLNGQSSTRIVRIRRGDTELKVTLE